MSKIFILILIFAAIFFWEARNLVKKKERRELVIFSILILIGFALSILLVFKSFI
ncbi:hypothetical protein [Bacillus sp. REN16]|uniref:hypothetical protein n=1 Tax=Bacillus sp. REN16 TaxID=2887296 RepID=UPI001E32D48B|nr:hypothetical protein [Bacillus sp. REN16]MCC3359526.1 hypothetical protein [Bacillus sp. REN16]